MEATVDERRELLAQDLDFAGLEQAITAQMNALGAELVKQVVEPLLVDEDYVERLKGLGGQRGLKFKEYRVVRVRLVSLDELVSRSFVFGVKRGAWRSV